MSTLHHESLLETCIETAIEEFCTSNKLTPEMFAEIEQHEGVQIALEKKALQIFDQILCMLLICEYCSWWINAHEIKGVKVNKEMMTLLAKVIKD